MIADFFSPTLKTSGGVEPIRHVGRVSLRTLVFVRWVVIVGQLVTVSIVALGFQFPMQLSAILTVIALAVLVNLMGTVMRRGRALSPGSGGRTSATTARSIRSASARRAASRVRSPSATTSSRCCSPTWMRLG